MHSLDRTRGVVRSRGNNAPNTNVTRKDPRYNYNSSSIPYLNKRGQDPNTMRQNGAGEQRPAGYDQVRVNYTGSSGLPSVM